MTNGENASGLKWFWLAAFVGFSAYTAWVVLQVGYIGVFTGGIANIGSTQVLVDLVLACLVALAWIAWDAKKRGITVWPFFVLTFSAGSIGLLAYMVWREFKRT